MNFKKNKQNNLISRCAAKKNLTTVKPVKFYFHRTIQKDFLIFKSKIIVLSLL